MKYVFHLKSNQYYFKGSNCHICITFLLLELKIAYQNFMYNNYKTHALKFLISPQGNYTFLRLNKEPYVQESDTTDDAIKC